MYDCLGIKVFPWKLCQSKNGVCDESPPKRWTVAETFAWRLICLLLLTETECTWVGKFEGGGNAVFLTDDIMTWEHFPYHCPFVRGIQWWLVDSPHTGPVMWSLGVFWYVNWTSCWTNNQDAGDLRCCNVHVTSLQCTDAWV